MKRTKSSRKRKVSQERVKISNNLTSLFLGSFVVVMGVLTVVSYVIDSSQRLEKEFVPTPTPFSTAQIIQSVVKAPLVEPTSKPEEDPRITYVVKKGDSVARIGKRLCNSNSAWVYIAEENNMYAPFILQTGDILTITCR